MIRGAIGPMGSWRAIMAFWWTRRGWPSRRTSHGLSAGCGMPESVSFGGGIWAIWRPGGEGGGVAGGGGRGWRGGGRGGGRWGGGGGRAACLAPGGGGRHPRPA